MDIAPTPVTPFSATLVTATLLVNLPEPEAIELLNRLAVRGSPIFGIGINRTYPIPPPSDNT